MPGDLEKAKREIRYAKSTADDRRWDSLEPKLQSIEAALDGVPEADKAPIAAEVAAMRAAMVKALREEAAGRIEREIQRNLSSAEDDFKRGYAESSSLQKAADRLATAEAREALGPEGVAKLQARVDAMRAQGAEAARAEKAGRIEREIQRSLAAAEDEMKRGYAESPQLAKAVERLSSAEAREVLSAESIAKLQAQAAALQGKPAPSPPPLKAASAAPAPAAPPAPPPPKVASAAPAAVPAAAPAVSEKARLIESDITRTLRFAVDEIDRNPLQGDSYLARLNTRLDSDEAREHLPAGTWKSLRAQVDELQLRSDALRKAERAKTLEGFIERFIRNGENDIAHSRGQAAGMLRNATERLTKDDVKELLSAESVARFRSEIQRVEKLLQAATKKAGLENAGPILEELEERITKPIFTDEQPAWKTMGELESLKTRVRGALYEVPKDDADVKKIEARLGKVDAKIATALAKLDRDQSFERVKQSWELEEQAIAGWEDEKGSPTAYEMPKTTLAVRRLTWFVNDKEIGAIGDAQKKDKPIQDLIAGAKKVRDAAVKKLHAAFNAVLDHLEKGPRPSNRIDLEYPSRLAGSAGSDFEGTPHQEANLKRAKALETRWDREIEAERKARQAKYDELSAVAAKAWPKIRDGVGADKDYDARSKGKRVLIEGLRNRIGWDFGGNYHFAIWMDGNPVVGNYDATVLAAVQAAIEKTRLCLDDHTDWDAVIEVGGPGKIKLRTEIIVRDRGGLQIGKIEEWPFVDATMCTVVALRAGPVAVGPKGV